MKPVTRSLLLLVPGLLIAGCSDTAGPGELAQLEALTPSLISETVGSTLDEPITVRALDGSGLPLAGVSLTWTATDGELTETATVTDENGRSSVGYTLSTEAVVAGEPESADRILVEAGGLDPLEFVVTPQPGTPVEMVITPSTLTLAAGETAPLATELFDSYGNPTTVVTVAYRSLDTGVATVDVDGLVQAEGAGTTRIVGQATPTVTDTVDVTVN